MHILNGESLINDASGLVAFRFAVAAVATGAFSWLEAGISLVLLAGGGALAGVAVAALIGEVRIRLTRFCVDDPTIQTMLSLLTPYAAYLVAERVSVSGILAVVAAGFYAGMHDTKNLSVATRRHAWEVWAMVLYVFNGLAFLLLGLQLKSVLERLPGSRGQALRSTRLPYGRPLRSCGSPGSTRPPTCRSCGAASATARVGATRGRCSLSAGRESADR
jgi:CPA1 family monovalent cation:H+ antiporter